MKIRRGDKIRVKTGKDKGREGKVEKVYRKQGKALIMGINMYKKHIKKSEQTPKGGVVELPRTIDVSKIAFLCKVCKRAVKLGFKLEGKKKLRICRKCESEV